MAVLFVLAHHCEVPYFGGGYSGVDLFFVLSGYLITTILRNEVAGSGRLNFGAFYWRRALRLWPPLLMMLALYALSAPWFFPKADVATDVLLAGTYLSDYSRAFWGVPDYIRHTWSLSVEEHFYLLWPLMIVGTAKWSGRRLVALFGLIFIIATMWRVVDAALFLNWERLYFRFDTRFSGLMLGATVAVLPWRPGRSADLIAAVSLTAFALIVVFLKYRWQFPVWTIFVDLASAGLVLAVAGAPGRVSAVLSWRPIVYVGLLSYSIYLVNYPIVRAMDHQFSVVTTLSVTLIGSLILAALCFEFVERPLRAYRHRVSRPPLIESARAD